LFFSKLKIISGLYVCKFKKCPDSLPGGANSRANTAIFPEYCGKLKDLLN
jgi:hypothetical protein